MKFHLIRLFPVLLLGIAMTSCLGKDEFDYSDWEKQNNQYFAEAKEKMENGLPYYESVTPVFAPSVPILMKWHNDRSKTANTIKPLDNSTVDCKYICYDIEGNVIDSSFKSTTYGDSIYRTKPLKNITGFWAALTNMHVGDSVTAVIPQQAAYGNTLTLGVKPYSTLIYGIKLTGVPAYELPD